MIEVRRATESTVLGMALRPEDSMELKAATGKSPVAVLRQSLQESKEAYTLHHQGTTLAAFGVVELGGPGVVWMVCSPEVSRHVRKVLHAMDYWAEYLADAFGGIQALAMADNCLHVRWCEHLGFVELGRYDISGNEFIHIYRPPTKKEDT